MIKEGLLSGQEAVVLGFDGKKRISVEVRLQGAVRPVTLTRTAVERVAGVTPALGGNPDI